MRFSLSLAALFLAVKAFILAGPDPIFSAPFISFDGYQWITDGLFYLDSGVDTLQRNPALPLIFAFLKWSGLLSFYPALQSLLLLLFFGGIFLLVREFAGKKASLLSMTVAFCCMKTHAFFDFILADPWCVVLVTYSVLFFIRSRESSRLLIHAFGLLGLAFNFQFAPAFYAPAFLWFLFSIHQRTFYLSLQRWKSIFIALGLFVAISAPQFLLKWVLFGSPLYSKVTHFPLLGFHLFGLPFYFFGFLAWVGWFFAFLIMASFFYSFFSEDRKLQFVNYLTISMLFFWVLLYKWLDVRFLLYVVPFWFVYLALAFEKIGSFIRARPNLNLLRTKVAALCVFLFGVSLPMRGYDAFDAFRVPITSQNILVLGRQQVMGLPHFAPTVENSRLELSSYHGHLWNMTGYFKYYSKTARAHREKAMPLYLDLSAMKQAIGSEAIGICGSVQGDHSLYHRVFWIFEKNPTSCERGEFQLLLNQDVSKEANPIYKGAVLTLTKNGA